MKAQAASATFLFLPFLPHRSTPHLPAATILPLPFNSNSPRFVSFKNIGSSFFPLDRPVFMRRSCLRAVSDDRAAAPTPTTSSRGGEPSGSHSNDVVELQKEFNKHGNRDNERAKFKDETYAIQTKEEAERAVQVDDDMQRHNELLTVVRQTPSEINAIVGKRRKDFTAEFFDRMHIVAESYYDNIEEQDGLVSPRLTCLAAVQAYDNASESIEALDATELKFQEILNSPSLGEACKKSDALAEKNQLDSALVLMLTKAWSTAKESTMMKDEVKDVLYHLYVTARGNLQRFMPKEIRILKYLLTIEDPKQQLSALKDAFTPGDELEGKDVDCLYTTPDKLHTWIRTVVDAYNFSREGTLIREARDLMNPTIIHRLEQLKVLVEKNFIKSSWTSQSYGRCYIFNQHQHKNEGKGGFESSGIFKSLLC